LFLVVFGMCLNSVGICFGMCWYAFELFWYSFELFVGDCLNYLFSFTLLVWFILVVAGRCLTYSCICLKYVYLVSSFGIRSNCVGMCLNYFLVFGLNCVGVRLNYRLNCFIVLKLFSVCCCLFFSARHTTRSQNIEKLQIKSIQRIIRSPTKTKTHAKYHRTSC